MKNLLKLSVFLFATVVLLSACSKRDWHDDRDREEYATVVSEDDIYPYIVIRFNNDGSYALIEALESNSNDWPEFRETLSGYFEKGNQTVYNVTGGFNNRIYVLEFHNREVDAFRARDYYIDTYGFSKKTTIQRSAAKRTVIK